MKMAKFLTKLRPKKAFALIEIMLAVFIFTLFSTGVLYLSLDVIQRDAKLPTTNEALLYAQEGIEASRNIRDQNFLLLETGDHGLSRLSGAWEFENTSETIDSYYTRTVTVEDVYRDAYGEITSAGGTLDPDMKKVASEVEWDWKDIFPKSITLTTHLSSDCGWSTSAIQRSC